ncbi:uncharacterized protein [Chironomus tepperi]|uniref:uncharacterized protein n=1 Tax=Chironomus tepperi TaxID=113505 RepID=UPI00391FC559
MGMINQLNIKWTDYRPLIIFFESKEHCRILYKNYGHNQGFMGVKDQDVQDVDDFSKLMQRLRTRRFGYFNRTFNDIKVYRSTERMDTETDSEMEQDIDAAEERGTIDDLMAIYGELKDFLCIRFLHLFDLNLLPSLTIITSILRDDMINNRIYGFCAVYGYDFHVKLHRGYNILMLAIELRNRQAAEILIQSQINLNTRNDFYEIAADIACRTRQFDILRTLIMHNSRYPHNYSNHPVELNDIQIKSAIIHDTIADIDESDESLFSSSKELIQNVISDYKDLKYWYNLSNVSAMCKAIVMKKFKTYQFLMDIGLFLGPCEDIEKIKEKLSGDEKQKISTIHEIYIDNLPQDYIMRLRSNSFIWQHLTQRKLAFDEIANAFQILNQNPYIQPILKIAALVNVRIIFDCNRKAAAGIDFTVHNNVQGLFQTVFNATKFQIFIGSEDLLNDGTKMETIGTLAHELTHLAMLVTYRNGCKPYDHGDLTNEINYKRICRRLNPNIHEHWRNNQERLISLVYGYEKKMWLSELATRAAHMMAQYHNDQNTLNKLYADYSDLFDDFQNRVTKDILDRIPDVRDTQYEDIRTEHAHWVKKSRKEKIIRYSLSTGIFMLISVLLGLGVWLVPLLGCKTFSKTCKWKELTKWEKDEIWNTKIQFNGHNMSIYSITDGHEDLMDFLSIDEIYAPWKISLNKQNNLKLNFEYFNRQYSDFDAKYAHTGHKHCEYSYPKPYNFQYIRHRSPFYILTGDPMSGISTELIHNTQILSQNDTVNWIAYLDLKTVNIDGYKNLKNWTSTNVTNFLINAHNLDDLSDFRAELFKIKFQNGEVRLFMDHIDGLFDDIGENFMSNLVGMAHNKSEMWFGVRNGLSSRMDEIIDPKVSIKVKLHPLYCEDRENYVRMLLSTAGLGLEQVEETVRRLDMILKPLEVWRQMRTTVIDNIYLIKVITNHTAESVIASSNSINLYQIIDEYIRKTANFENLPKDANRNMFGKSVMLHILNSNYQLKDVNVSILINDYAIDYKYYELPRADAELTDITNGFIMQELKLGIYVKNAGNKVDFISKIYFEYFLAQYIKDELWMKIKYANKGLIFRNKVNLLLNIFWDMYNNFPVVKRCIEDFVKDNRGDGAETRAEYNSEFLNVFRDLFGKFSSGTNINVGENMTTLFEDDLGMLAIVKRNSSRTGPGEA